MKKISVFYMFYWSLTALSLSVSVTHTHTHTSSLWLLPLSLTLCSQCSLDWWWVLPCITLYYKLLKDRDIKRFDYIVVNAFLALKNNATVTECIVNFTNTQKRELLLLKKNPGL